MQDPMLSLTNQVAAFFMHVDTHQWDKVKDCFAKTVLLDYSSYSGQPAAELTADAIVEGWAGFLPNYDFTHHQIGNMIANIDGARACVTCYGTATHFKKGAKGGDHQFIFGHYDLNWTWIDGGWRLAEMTFHFRGQAGNPDLLAA